MLSERRPKTRSGKDMSGPDVIEEAGLLFSTINYFIQKFTLDESFNYIQFNV